MKETYVVYGISDCPACLRACADLMALVPAIEYVFVNCDFSKNYRDNLRSKDKFNWPTFPIVVKLLRDEETLVGGYDELKEHLQVY